eukprot:640049-Rhodomonas_salina.1
MKIGFAAGPLALSRVRSCKDKRYFQDNERWSLQYKLQRALDRTCPWRRFAAGPREQDGDAKEHEAAEG